MYSADEDDFNRVDRNVGLATRIDGPSVHESLAPAKQESLHCIRIIQKIFVIWLIRSEYVLKPFSLAEGLHV